MSECLITDDDVLTGTRSRVVGKTLTPFPPETFSLQ